MHESSMQYTKETPIYWVYNSNVHSSQNLDSTKVFMIKGMYKENAVSIHTMEYKVIKKKVLPISIEWIPLYVIMLNEINQTQKDKSCMLISFI